MTDVVANEIVIEISKGIIGQAKRNINQVESTFAVDMNEAVLAAERVVLNVNIFLPDLELRLGSQQRAEMQNALQDLKEAIRTNDASKALVAGSAINEIIAAYEGELN